MSHPTKIPPPQLRVAVLFHNDITPIKFAKKSDPQWGYGYAVTIMCTDNPHAKSQDFFQQQSIPCHILDWDEYGPSYEDNFFQALANLLVPVNPDIIICSEFRKLPQWFIHLFPCIINIHPVPLDILDDNNYPLYGGLDREAIQKFLYLNAERIQSDTRVTIHSTAVLIQEHSEFACGTIIAISEPCVISKKDTPETLLARMMSLCNGPALIESLHTIIAQKHALHSILCLTQIPTISLPLLMRYIRLRLSNTKPPRTQKI